MYQFQFMNQERIQVPSRDALCKVSDLPLEFQHPAPDRIQKVVPLRGVPIKYPLSSWDRPKLGDLVSRFFSGVWAVDAVAPTTPLSVPENRGP